MAEHTSNPTTGSSDRVRRLVGAGRLPAAAVWKRHLGSHRDKEGSMGKSSSSDELG